MQAPASLSAVIPTYNRAGLIGRAIESVLAQTYPAAEILVVDDGSEDNTRRIVEAYAERVRYVFQTNAGVSAARNHGVRMARHEWVAFLDSDDYWTPDHLSRMAKAIKATEGKAPLYFTDLQLPEGNSTYWRSCGMTLDGEFEYRLNASEWAFMRVQPMMFQASVIRRDVYIALGGLPDDLRTREDTLLFYKMALLHPACAVSGCGTVMNSDDRIRLTQVYHSDTRVSHEAFVRLLRELVAHHAISNEHNKILRQRLSTAYYSMGCFNFRNKMVFEAVENAVMAWEASPGAFARELMCTVKRHISITKRKPPERMAE